MSDYIKGRATAAAWRWEFAEFCPGKYMVSVTTGYPGFCANFRAVVDDFGNLVEVPA